LQHLTWIALKSNGAQQSDRRVAHHIDSQVSDSNSPKAESDKNQKEASQKSETKEKVLERYKDRIGNLTIVSTLIITASVATCLDVPGEAEGKAHNLCHAMFHAFIIFITISLFSSISATIILFWATLGF